jgi:transposase
MKEFDKILKKDFLISQYSTKSTQIIAKEVGCSKHTISKYLRKFDIPRRTFGGSQPNAGRPKGIKDSYRRKPTGIKYTLTEEQYKDYIKDKSRKWYLNNKEKALLTASKYLKDNPWLSHYKAAKQRCTNPKCESYRFYGERGIKFLMSVADFKFLWFRDKAWLLKKPSIDRIDQDGNYELSNCQFIELVANKKKQRFHNQFTVNKVTDCSHQI